MDAVGFAVKPQRLITASLHYQTRVRGVLGDPDSHEHHQLTSYWRRDDVEAVKLVDMLYAVATANV